MTNQITVADKNFTIGSRWHIANKMHEVYNVMPELDGGLVAFCRISKAGKRTKEHRTLSAAQLETLIAVGTVK